MRAAVFYGKEDIRVEQIDMREPKPDEVLVKIAFCGICGTDLHIYHGDEGSAETIPPKILGHEMAGVVEAVGANVTWLQAGDHVVIDPNSYCGHCYDCRNGQPHFCEKMVGVGTTIDGGFAEYCTLPAQAVMHVNKDLPLEVAAFAEPLACCVHGMDLTNVQVGDQVLLVGGGTIGLLMLQLAKLAGASKLMLVEPDAEKRELAACLGADLTFENAAACLSYFAAHDGVRADKVIECVGKAETVEFAIQAAAKGATVMLFGLTAPKATVPIYPFELFRKELHITASFVNPMTQARAVALLENGKVEAGKLIGEIIPLEKLEEALREPRYRKLTKVMVKL